MLKRHIWGQLLFGGTQWVPTPFLALIRLYWSVWTWASDIAGSVQFDLLWLLGHTLGQGIKCSLTPRRLLAAKSPPWATVLPTPVPLHYHTGICFGQDWRQITQIARWNRGKLKRGALIAACEIVFNLQQKLCNMTEQACIIYGIPLIVKTESPNKL